MKDNHDLAGNNGSARDPTITRLAGTWVGPQLARTLGASYKIGFLIDAVVQARPDPNVSYRRSAKRDPEPPTTPTPKPVPKSLSAPSPAVPGPGPAKRRKESSPVPSAPPVESSKPPSTRSRRSVRTKSPTPKATSSVIITTTRRSTRRPVEVPSDETAVDEDAPVAAVASEELHDQDVADQRELIAGMMAEREVSRKAVSESPKKSPTKSKIKRSREEEEEELRFDFKEPEVGERAIATNARVGVWQGMAPQNRSFAWGVAAFVFGAGAVYVCLIFFFFVPQLISQQSLPAQFLVRHSVSSASLSFLSPRPSILIYDAQHYA